MAVAQVYYEDVQEGEHVRPTMEYLDQMALIRWSVVSGNNDVNHFAIFKTRLENKQPSVTGQFMMALADKMLTEWAGPKAWVKKLNMQYRAWEFFHDLKTFTGTISAKYEENGESLVDLVLQVARGDQSVTCKGTATVSLPKRNA